MALYWALGDYGDTTSIPINSSPLAPRDTASMQDLEMISLFSSQVYSKYVCLCLSVWVIYDYFLVTDDSVNLFWSHRWSISKVLFYLSRYMTILTVPLTTIELFTPNPSDTFCRVYPWVWLVGSIILMAIMNLVLISRIYALWNRSRIILIFTMFGLIFQLSWFFGVVAYTNAIATLAHSPPPFTGCLSAAATSLGWTVLVPPICNEAILIVLTAIKTYPIVVQHGFNAPLYNLLLRDGFLYFFLIIIIHVTSLISVFRPGPLTIILVVSFPGLSIIGVSCTRLLLRLQRALISGDSEPQTEFDRSEVTRNWPIVTFGGSGGNHKNQKTTGLNHTSAYRSQLPILALPRIDNGVRSSRIRHEHEEITIGRVEADGDGLTALELNIKSLDGAYDDAGIK